MGKTSRQGCKPLILVLVINPQYQVAHLICIAPQTSSSLPTTERVNTRAKLDMTVLCRENLGPSRQSVARLAAQKRLIQSGFARYYRIQTLSCKIKTVCFITRETIKTLRVAILITASSTSLERIKLDSRSSLSQGRHNQFLNQVMIKLSAPLPLNQSVWFHKQIPLSHLTFSYPKTAFSHLTTESMILNSSSNDFKRTSTSTRITIRPL